MKKWSREADCCVVCGKDTVPHKAFSKCKRCYETDRMERLAKKEGRWAHSWDKCKVCGTVRRPHLCRGLCERCYKARFTKNLSALSRAKIRKGCTVVVNRHGLKATVASNRYEFKGVQCVTVVNEHGETVWGIPVSSLRLA